ncbi:MAG: RIP metalloprotease RseP [Bacteroidota bacterium]
METFIMVAQLILGLSILVSLHEFGHFITAKWFGMRVHKFYLFFDFLFPLPNVLNFALFKKKVGDTEYGLGWFPLGGYVSIAGMIDETQEAKDLAATPEPWEFRAKPAWQRLIVMLGGVIVNVILGVFIFICLTKSNGENYTPMSEVNKRGIAAYELGQYAGLKTGDKILKTNGKDLIKFEDIRSSDILMGDKSYFTVDRGGKIMDVYLPDDFLNKLADNKAEFVAPIYHFEVKEVEPSLQKGSNEEDAISPAAKAGIKPGDKIVAFNNKPIEFYHEFKQALNENKGKKITMVINRAGQLDSLNLSVTDKGRTGIVAVMKDDELKPVHEDLTLSQSISIGTSRAFSVITDNMKGFGKIFSGKVRADKALSGPIEIAQMYGSVWDWNRFWMLTGLLSMALAFMNLLPIPALDGGHAVFLIYEMIVGKAPSEKFMERAQAVGTFILLGLMIFVIGNGIFKSFN